MKNSNNAIGNRIRDLPACIAVPESTASPRVSRMTEELEKSVRVAGHQVKS
jgi:hypothetical protein